MRTYALGCGLLAFLGACTENNGDSLSLQEKEALTTAVFNSAALDAGGAAAGFGPLAVWFLPNVGSLGPSTAAARAVSASLAGVQAATYEGAVGFQVIFTSSGTSSTFTGVFGWAGLNATANTVDEIVASGAFTSTSSPVGSGSSTTINGTTGFGIYWQRSPAASYAPGTSGSFVLTSATFSGQNRDCSSLSETTSCNYTLGTMTGNFAFTAAARVGTGSYTQSLVNFTSIPAVRLTIVE